MARRHVPPFETEITGLDERGLGIGLTPSGEAARVRAAPPGARVAVVPFRRKPGEVHARRMHLIRPPPDAVTPRCDAFGVCGGCTLQELHLDAQRAAKHAAVLAATGGAPRVHAPRGAPDAYGYRNKVELSFGPVRFVAEGAFQKGVTPLDGRFLGLHAPGRFDRIVDRARCDLTSPHATAVLTAARAVALAPDAPPPYHPVRHDGVLRHLVLREGFATGELLVVLHTTSGVTDAFLDRFAAACLATPLDGARVVGVVHRVHDGVADVAGGPIARVDGEGALHERLLGRTFRISPDSFFQTSTAGAEVLYRTIGEALGGGGTLYDLYCGAGSIGICLADRFDGIVGVEVMPEAVRDARDNAARNRVDGVWHAGAMEDALAVLPGPQRAGPRHLVVDPPRAGLHPRVAGALATVDADTLVYVACRPASLGRDRVVLEAGGWRATDLWTVDLFPQTGHVEAVMRFVRPRRA